MDALSAADRARYEADLGASASDIAGQGNQTPSGCSEEADEATRKPLPQLSDTIVNEIAVAQRAVERDASYVAAEKRWASCMQGKRFAFNHAAEAQRSISDVFGAETAGSVPSAGQQELELRTARADAACSLHTVWEARSKVETAILQRFVDKYGRLALCGGPTC